MSNPFNLIITLFATTLGAISGIGGGIIIKPIYDAFSTLDVSTISFMSGCTVLSMSIISLLKVKNSGIKLDKFKSSILAIGAAIGGIFGKTLFQTIKLYMENDKFIGSIQSFILILMTVYVFWFVKNKSKIAAKNIQNTVITSGIGFFLGMISSFLGIGGGPVNIAILSYFFNLNSKEATINSIYIIFFSQATNLLTTFITRTVPIYNSNTLLLMISGGIFGGLIGSSLVKKLSNHEIDKIFLYVLTLILFISSYNFTKFTFLTN